MVTLHIYDMYVIDEYAYDMYTYMYYGGTYVCIHVYCGKGDVQQIVETK